ncbi:MAG: VTT domain-containing protein [Stackebrandtia sp.]
MTLFAATFCYCVVSALVPVVNAEAYVGGAGALPGNAAVLAVAAVAAAGQMVGKLAYFWLGQNSLNWPWIRNKTESPKWKAAFDRWQRRIDGNRWSAGGILFASASAGLPPFAVMSVLAGQLRMSLPLFLVVGFVGRFARFAAVLGLVDFLF